MSYRSLLNKLLKKNVVELRDYQVGPHTIQLPKGHKLDSFQSRFPRYDVALGELSRLIYRYYPNFTAIDIGANVGDTAALICKYQKVPVLCIEGLPDFIGILKKNIEVLGNHIFVEPSFVGSGYETIPDGLSPKFGSCSLLKEETSGSSKTLSLSQILQKHPKFLESKLIKIDTDGFDFKIILSSMNEIQRMKPILFWEYDICFEKRGDQDALETLQRLKALGYAYFVLYDNFGNYLMSLEGIEKFEELNLYLLSNKYHARIVPYFDVCAFHSTPQDVLIFNDLVAYEKSHKTLFVEKLAVIG